MTKPYKFDVTYHVQGDGVDEQATNLFTVAAASLDEARSLLQDEVDEQVPYLHRGENLKATIVCAMHER